MPQPTPERLVRSESYLANYLLPEYAVSILDELTAGFPLANTGKLLDVLTKVGNQGNTLIVNNQNLEVIKAADWVTALGPEVGVGAVQIVANGPPEYTPEVEPGHTGR